MKRGRRPIHRKAMTAAERQARHRAKLRKIANDARKRSDEYKRALGEVRLPPYGYNKVKAKLQTEGHDFERARREFGFEEGLFLDGALMTAHDVMALAEMSRPERLEEIAKTRGS
jgi:hypothetical protein